MYRVGRDLCVFFQAEDGIRDIGVTGVQTCALPIWSILRTPLTGGRLEWVAWGFRNPYGLAFGPDGCLYCTDNMYDERGCRPIYGAGDLLWRVQPGVWYGFPDYYGNIPVTHPRFAQKRRQTPPGFLLARHPNVPPEPVAW